MWIGLALALVASALIGSLILVMAAALADVPLADYADDIPLSVVALTQIPLWLGYLGVPVWAARTKGNGLRIDFRLAMRWVDVPLGLVVGVVTQILVIPLLYLPLLQLTDIDADDLSSAARELTDKANDPVGVALLVLIVVVMAPIIEEIFFRGLFQQAANRRFGGAWGVILPALVFGAVHLQLLQLPALVVFGVVAGVLTARTDRLGPAIWAHVGFNGVAVLSLLSG